MDNLGIYASTCPGTFSFIVFGMVLRVLHTIVIPLLQLYRIPYAAFVASGFSALAVFQLGVGVTSYVSGFLTEGQTGILPRIAFLILIVLPLTYVILNYMFNSVTFFGMSTNDEEEKRVISLFNGIASGIVKNLVAVGGIIASLPWHELYERDKKRLELEGETVEFSNFPLFTHCYPQFIFIAVFVSLEFILAVLEQVYNYTDEYAMAIFPLIRIACETVVMMAGSIISIHHRKSEFLMVSIFVGVVLPLSMCVVVETPLYWTKLLPEDGSFHPGLMIFYILLTAGTHVMLPLILICCFPMGPQVAEGTNVIAFPNAELPGPVPKGGLEEPIAKPVLKVDHEKPEVETVPKVNPETPVVEPGEKTVTEKPPTAGQTESEAESKKPAKPEVPSRTGGRTSWKGKNKAATKILDGVKNDSSSCGVLSLISLLLLL